MKSLRKMGIMLFALIFAFIGILMLENNHANAAWDFPDDTEYHVYMDAVDIEEGIPYKQWNIAEDYTHDICGGYCSETYSITVPQGGYVYLFIGTDDGWFDTSSSVGEYNVRIESDGVDITSGFSGTYEIEIYVGTFNITLVDYGPNGEYVLTLTLIIQEDIGSPDFMVGGYSETFTAGDVVTAIGNSVYVSSEDGVTLTATDFAGNIVYGDVYFYLGHGIWDVCYGSACITVMIYRPMIIIDNEINYFVNGDTLELEAGTEIKFADYLLYHEDGIYYSPDGAVLDAETDDIVVSVQNILYDTWTYQDEEGHYLETGEYHVIVQWGICGGGFNQFFGTSNLYISVVSDTIANPDVAIVLNNTSYDFNWSSTSSYGYTEIAIRGTSVSYGGIESDYLDNIYWESYSNTGQYTCINETWCSGNTTIPTTLSEGAHWFSFRLTNGQSGTFAIIIHQPRFTLGGTTYAITDGYTYFINDGDSIKMNAAGGYVLFKDVSSGICNEEAADCYANVGYVYDNEDTGIHSYGYHEYNVWANYQLYVAVDYGTGYMNFNLNFNIMIINDDSIAESISPGSVSSGKFKIAINSGTVLNSKYSSASTVKYFVGKSSNYSSSSEIAAGMTKYGVSTTLSALKSGNIYSSLGLTGNVKLYVQIDSKYFVSGTITINSNGGGTVTLSQVGEENEIVEELATPVVLTSDILTSENLTNNKTNILFVFAMIIVSMLLAIEVIAIKKSKKTTKKSI